MSRVEDAVMHPMTGTASLQGPDVSDRFDDERLVEGLAAGEPAAFERLFERYVDPLGRYVYQYVLSWNEAEDVVREVFARFWERRSDSEVLRDPESYLYTLARDQALKHLLQRQPSQPRKRPYSPPVLIEGGPIVPADPAQQVAGDEIGAAIQRAVGTLPEAEREALRLRGQHQSDDVIAAKLGIAPAMVDDLLRRAVDHLVRVLPRFLG